MSIKEVLETLKLKWDTAASAIGSCRSTCNYFSRYYILRHYAVFYYTSISFVAHKLIHFSSNLQLKKPSQRTFLQWVKDVDVLFSETAKSLSFLSCCFCQVASGRFCVTEDICTFRSERRRSSMETVDMMMMMMMQERLREVPVNLRRICFAACGM